MANRRNRKLSRDELDAELNRLQRREALFDASEAFAHIGHFEWNATRACLVSCSQCLASFFDSSVEALLNPETGMAIMLQQVVDEDRSRYQALFDASGDSLSLDIEFRVRRADSGLRHLYQAVVEVSAVDGEDTILAAVVQDVTAQVETESDYEYRESLALQAERISELGNFI
jgi:PAS domain-containing protein